MNKQTLVLFIAMILGIVYPLCVYGTRVPLDHSVYDDWKNIARQQLSNDGRWASYELNPQNGDGSLILVNLQTGATDTVARGQHAVFSAGSDYIAYLIRPEKKVVRQARKEYSNTKWMPEDQLGIRRLYDDKSRVFEHVASFAVAERMSTWMAFHKSEAPGDTLEGAELVIFNPIDETRHRFERVTSYAISANGQLVAFLREKGDREDAALFLFDTRQQTKKNIFSGAGQFHNITIDEEGSRVAFLYTENREEPYDYSIHYWSGEEDMATAIVSANTAGMPDGWGPSHHAPLTFAGDKQRLFFGTAPIPQAEPQDTLLPEERHRLDVWHYRDPLIQPMQLVRKEDEKNRTYTAVFHFNDRRMVQLADRQMPDITTCQSGDGRLEMGESKLSYLIPNSFKSGDYRDVYLVDIKTGERQLALEKHRGSVHLSTAGDARLSPGGNFLIYYNQADKHWYSLSTRELKKTNITTAIHHPLYDELHDAPGDPDPYGIGGWMEEDSHVLIYDRFDIWKVDPTGKQSPVLLTGGYGREHQIRFRYVDPDPDNKPVGRRDRILLQAFHIYTKQSGFYSVNMHQPGNPKRMTMDDVRYHRPLKAQDADLFLWRKSSFTTYPYLWVSDMFFNNPRRISDANPQQDQYLWGSVRLVDWHSFGNEPLQGLLYMPEDLDTTKKHPMIVYFYERSSDGLHLHQVPSPSRSTINRSFYVSNGYIVFVPDIHYRIGYPGQSAYDAIVSGTKAMLNQFDFIDRERIGIQGQSWAGYQIAWLVTRTDMFRAAMAGAPVSNMISAYGGIRWITGMSRIYQYEETQSRIGGTIWNKTMQYIENSPVFFANRVNTPLLMMHNDADGAVPWTQGIEYFMALRRLDKPVWMLNYNDEAHNLTRRPNMVDLSIRMNQFFDHYLKDKAMPLWMKQGIPAVRKGIENGYQLVD